MQTCDVCATITATSGYTPDVCVEACDAARFTDFIVLMILVGAVVGSARLVVKYLWS